MAGPDLLGSYLAGIESVRHAVHGLGPEQIRAHPVPGMWSALDVVCHLADSEALFAERMKRVLSEDRPALPFSDPERCVSALAYARRDAQEEVACIESVRRQMARILRAQPAEVWLRVGIHSREGEQSLEQLLRKAVQHLEHHVAFLREKRRILERPAEPETASLRSGSATA